MWEAMPVTVPLVGSGAILTLWTTCGMAGWTGGRAEDALTGAGISQTDRTVPVVLLHPVWEAPGRGVVVGAGPEPASHVVRMKPRPKPIRKAKASRAQPLR
jgi:hypothetical protein